jgi:hypothetical protein
LTRHEVYHKLLNVSTKNSGVGVSMTDVGADMQIYSSTFSSFAGAEYSLARFLREAISYE